MSSKSSLKTKKLLAEVAAACASLDAVCEALADHRASRRIKCATCDKSHPINKLMLVVTHRYTGPHGCTGGDYWSEGDWCFVCPATGLRNRFLFNDYDVDYEKRLDPGVAGAPAFKQRYQKLFAKRLDVHEEDHQKPPSVNNEYVDQHRELFELPAKSVKP